MSYQDAQAAFEDMKKVESTFINPCLYKLAEGLSLLVVALQQDSDDIRAQIYQMKASQQEVK